MLSNDFFKRVASVESFWNFYMILFREYKHKKLTRSKIAKEMGKSSALVTGIVNKLQPLNLISMIYDQTIEGTSKYSVTFFFSDILFLLTNELDYNEEQIDELCVTFDTWIKQKNLDFDFNSLEQSGLITFFQDSFFSDIAKKVPLFFFFMLFVTLMISLMKKDEKTNEFSLLSISPIPKGVRFFSYKLLVKMLTDIFLYFNERFFSSYALSLIDRFLTPDNSLGSMIISLQNSLLDIEEDELDVSLSVLVNLIEQKKHWTIGEQWVRVNTLLSLEEIQEIDNKAEIIVKIPLKNGKYKILNVPSLLEESQLLKKYIEIGN